MALRLRFSRQFSRISFLEGSTMEKRGKAQENLFFNKEEDYLLRKLLKNHPHLDPKFKGPMDTSTTPENEVKLMFMKHGVPLTDSPLIADIVNMVKHKETQARESERELEKCETRARKKETRLDEVNAIVGGTEFLGEEREIAEGEILADKAEEAEILADKAEEGEIAADKAEEAEILAGKAEEAEILADKAEDAQILADKAEEAQTEADKAEEAQTEADNAVIKQMLEDLVALEEKAAKEVLEDKELLEESEPSTARKTE